MRPRMSRIKFFNMSNCEQPAVWLLGMLSFTTAVCLRPGGDIMTCRVARLSQDLLRIDLAFCPGGACLLGEPQR